MEEKENGRAGFKTTYVDSDSDGDDIPLVKRKSPRTRKLVEDNNEFLKKRTAIQEEYAWKIPKKTTSSVKEKRAKLTAKKEKMAIKVQEDESTMWRWWVENEKYPGGVKWRTLEHRGPLFAPEYEPLPTHVR